MPVGAGPLLSVADAGDPRLADYHDLADPEGRRRRESDRAVFVAEGRLAVAALLASPYAPVSLLVDEQQLAAVSSLVDAMRARGAPVYVASRPVLAAAVGFPFHRGIVAVGRRPPEVDGLALLAAAIAAEPAPLIGVVEAVNDHENLGALFRNAAAFGVRALLLDPTCADPLYRRCVRVSVGHALAIPFGRLAPWPAALAALRAAGALLVALSPRPRPGRPTLAPEALASARRTRPVALLVGAEGAGVSEAAERAADATVAISMAAGVDSLNVATAAAIAFYAASRPPST